MQRYFLRSLNLKSLLLIFLGMTVGAPLWAADGDVMSVLIQNAAVIQTAYGGHQAGNLEVKILNGFAMPPGVSCDSTYLTTLKSADPDKRLFALLAIAQTTQKPINLHITDDPTYTAFGGRCSIMGASLQ